MSDTSLISVQIAELIDSAPEAVAGVEEIGVAMSLITCTECGVVFAIPRELMIARAEKAQPIHCPSGHTTIIDPEELTTRNMLRLHLRAMVELRKRTAELNRTKLQIARAAETTAGEVSPEEFKRRLRILANRAERTNDRRLTCTWCGGSYSSPYDFRQHVQRKHHAEVRSLPAGFFD
jgi:hypothetical protein